MTKTQKSVGGLKKSIPVFNPELELNRSESTWKKKLFYCNTCLQYAKSTNDAGKILGEILEASPQIAV